MKDKNYIKDLLYRSLDAPLSPEEEQALAQGLADFPELERERSGLLRMRRALGEIEISGTPNAFSESVQRKIKQPVVISLQSWAPQIAAASVIVVLAFILSLYFGEGSMDTTAILGLEELSPEEAYTLLNY